MRYRVKTPVHHGDCPSNVRRYEPGEVIELNEQSAAPLLKVEAVEAWKPETVELVLNPQFSK